MKTSKGRLKHYQILSSDDNFSKYLLETELLTVESLFIFLKRYKIVVIKPSQGSEEMIITSAGDKLMLVTELGDKELVDLDVLFNRLSEHKSKKWIIQPANPQSGLIRLPYSIFTVTVHRNSPDAEWHYVSSADKNKSLVNKYIHSHHQIIKLSILAASKLGAYYPDCHTAVFEIGAAVLKGIWIKDIILHFKKSKWNQHQILSSNNDLISYLPNTEVLTKGTFYSFISNNNEVIIKPCIGRHGLGIVSVMKTDSPSIEIQSGKMRKTFSGIDEAYEYINSNYLSKKPYLVQEKLALAEIEGCPFDIRVIVQKRHLSWEVTGKLIKVASPDFFVTNVAQKLLDFRDLSHLAFQDIDKLESDIDNICVSACKQLEGNYPQIKIIGFDIGVSISGDIWIIEGNYNPDLSMFMGHRFNKMYKRMRKIIKSRKKPHDQNNT